MQTKKLTGLTAVFVCGVFVISGVAGAGETWRLTEEGSLQKMTEQPEDQFLAAAAQIKQLISQGKEKQAAKQLEAIKKDYPDQAGPELDAFVKAEKLYARRNWVKAAQRYDRFLQKYPDSRLCDSVLERQYEIALAFLNGEKRRVLGIFKLSAYEEAATIINRIADRTGNSPIAKRGLVSLARSYEKRKDYMQAYETWADISSRWPTGPTGQEALFRRAENLNASFRGTAFTDTGIRSAKVFYNEYRLRYPESAGELEVEEKMTVIDEQMATKQLETGQYYHKTGSIEAAKVYYQMVIDTWSQTQAARKAAELIEGGHREAKVSVRKRLFDKTSSFLDNWFGFRGFFGKKANN